MYVRIQDGQIIEGPGPLPKVAERINGFDKLSDFERRDYGWFPFEGSEPPQCDTRTHKVVPRVVFGPVVRLEHTVEPLSESEVAANFAQARQEKLEDNADYRWQKETNGIDFYGVPPREVPIPIHTDRDSQITIFAAALRGQDEMWKARDGEWYPLSGDELALLSESIAQHKRICFETESEFASMIKGCDTFAELDEIDLEALWNSV